MRASLLLFVAACMAGPSFTQSVHLEPFASGSANPVDIDNMGDSRLFITERAGRIKILRPDGSFDQQAFLDISDRVNSTGSEQGLLGMTFDPQFLQNGYFYVNYIHGDGAGSTRISRFTISPDPDVADPESEFIIWSALQPGAFHNGGDLSFGPDGNLWFALGDGGGDPALSQDLLSPHGKMLRIDVHGGSPYAIPADNPYANGDLSLMLPEIWAAGLRNPFRFSFDPLTGNLFIADVGQHTYEEIDIVVAGSAGGANFGWPCFEGTAPYHTEGCGPYGEYEPPVAVHHHSDGSCSVIGGYVYRGTASPALYGTYLYTDFCHGRIHALVPDGSGGWTQEQLTGSNGFGFAAMGVDQHGELLVAKTNSGQIYRLNGPSGDQVVSLELKVFLDGPFDPVSGSMHDALRVLGLVPSMEPYTAMGMTQAAGGGGEIADPGVLAITGGGAVVDWLRVELRDPVDHIQLVATRQALLLRNGDVLDAAGGPSLTFPITPGDYHVVVRHRNHLGVMTAAPIQLDTSPITLDLRDPGTPTTGNDARKIVGATALLWAGDVNGDGMVKYAGPVNDRDPVLLAVGGNIPTATSTGYLPEDVNMDGVVRYTGEDNDRDVILLNIGGVVPTNVLHGQAP